MLIPGDFELKYKLICSFKLAADMVRDGIRKSVNDANGPAFLERELMGLGVVSTGRSEFTTMQEAWCPFTCFETI